MRCCWMEVEEARGLGPCWAGAALVIAVGALGRCGSGEWV